MIKTPILFIIFNRPDTTQRVFDQIKKAQPEQLFIAADGPRENHLSDLNNCNQTRGIINQIDWKCDVKTLFHETNLGCGLAPYTAINWFFDHVEEGIIIEDDCLPSDSFFPFCEKLLEYYRYDTRIFHIGGTSYTQYLKNTSQASYYFTKIPKIWGWATWKRAWNKYSFTMDTFEEFKKQEILKTIFQDDIAQIAWTYTFSGAYSQLTTNKKPSFWDLQWTYTVMTQRGLCISPTQNLISNIGFDPRATHTTENNDLLSNTSIEYLDFTQFQHPTYIATNKEEENWVLKNVFNIQDTFSWKVRRSVKNNFPWLVKIRQTFKTQ